MKKILNLTLLVMFNQLTSIGQINLVPNSSFEDTVFGSPCYCQGAIEMCVKNWFNPHGATPDYYTYFSGYCTGVSSVNNSSGFQLAKTGSAYAGIYGIVSPNRDYIAVRLLDTLLQGECYYIEFYVSLANLVRYAIDNLGCYFTNDTTGYKSITTNIPVVPQVLNQSGNFLSDTMNWQKVSGSFVAAGGETFLIIGNFYNDSNTILDTVNPGSTWQTAYYYVDDVFVTPCDSLAGVNNNSDLQNFRAFPLPASNTLYVLSDLTSDCKIKLYSIRGTELTSQVVIQRFRNGWQLNISNLSSGVYFLTLTNSSNNSQIKFIKQ